MSALRRGWFPVARGVDLDRPRRATLFGRRLVVFRSADGHPRVLPDRCLHRGGTLHGGAVVGDAIECPYHRWQWRGADGQCVHIPSDGSSAPIPKTAVIGSYPAAERFGLVWTWLGPPSTPPVANGVGRERNRLRRRPRLYCVLRTSNWLSPLGVSVH